MEKFEYYVDNLNVVYEDNHLIVIEKPKDVLCQKDDTLDFDITDIVKEYLKKKYDKKGNVYLGLLHRLDRRVSGLLVLAKTSKAASRMSKIIMDRKMDKIYLAYAQGIVDKKGNINIKILKKDTRAVVRCDGKDANLSYELINVYNNNSYVKVKLDTGRYNQIRVSFAHINHPLVGDLKYGASIKSDDIGLYCAYISFIHPIKNEKMEFKLLPKGNIWDGMDIKKTAF